jgi:hypothetical protein
MTGDLLNHSLLLLGCIYYALISKGVVKLPRASQDRFDRQTNKRKQLWLVLDCILIIILIILIVKDFYKQ